MGWENRSLYVSVRKRLWLIFGCHFLFQDKQYVSHPDVMSPDCTVGFDHGKGKGIWKISLAVSFAEMIAYDISIVGILVTPNQI
jgi:hypothetical protein